MEGDCTYFRRRAEEERAAAANAADARARDSHVELAERYENLAGAIADTERGLGLGSADELRA